MTAAKKAYDEQRESIKASLASGDFDAAVALATSQSFHETRIAANRSRFKEELIPDGEPPPAGVVAEVAMVSALSALQSAGVVLSMAKAMHDRLVQRAESADALLADLDARLAALEAKR
jgi:hypothetical protein